MQLTLLGGATSQSIPVSIQDSSSTTGAGLSGLVFNTSGLTAYYWRPGGSPTAITLATLAAITTAYSSGGFKEADATNLKGVYRLDIPDAAIAAGVPWVAVYLYGATNMVPCRVLIFLTAVNPQSATAFVTGINSLAPPTNWNLESIDGSGRVDVGKVGGTSQTARDIGASVLISPGTGAGQLDVTSGVVKANLSQILGTALTETAGLLAAGFKKFFNVASPAATMDHGVLVDTVTTYTGNTVQTGDAYARLGAPAGASVSADVAAVKTDTGNLVTRITATLFSGITSLAQWLGLLSGKQVGNTTARTEIRATGAGSGTFDETTDSQEALRDRGDAAWITATGFSTLDAAGVRTAVGLASANLDTQLAAIAGYIDTEVAAIKAKTDNLPAAPAAVGDIPTVSQIWTTALTESYRATGAAGTAAQLMHEILQNLTEFSIATTTKTVKKFDGSTTAKTYTLNDATTPTSITETT